MIEITNWTSDTLNFDRNGEFTIYFRRFRAKMILSPRVQGQNLNSVSELVVEK